MLNQAKVLKRSADECWPWLGFKSRDGYGIVHKQGKLLKAHRIAYCDANSLSISDIELDVVRHSCDNRGCVNPAHLTVGTSADNTQDRHDRNRDARGSVNGNSKLTEHQVMAIRGAYVPRSKCCGYSGLAKLYEVSESLIAQIVRREIWTHV